MNDALDLSLLRKRIAELTKAAEGEEPLQSGGGGGNSGDMEPRVAVLEANVSHIKDDISEMKKDLRELRSDAKVEFRITFGAIIFVALGLAGLMAKGFHWF